MQLFIAINGPDHALVDELMRFIHERLIFDGASRCVHVARVKRSVVSSRSFDLHRTIAINCDRYNSLDGRLRLISI